MLPAFRVCEVCHGSGVLMDCAWDPEDGDEWCWDDPCDSCAGKGHVLAPPRRDPAIPWHEEPTWQVMGPARPDGFGQWEIVQVHKVTGERRVVKSRTEASVTRFASEISDSM